MKSAAVSHQIHKISFQESLSNLDLRGRLVESCVGTYLLSNSNADIFYWREDNEEVDFIAKLKGKIIAIEVKSGKKFKAPSGGVSGNER